jgi:hypothetical protein
MNNGVGQVKIKQQIEFWNPFSRSRNFLDVIYDRAARFFAQVD